MKALDELVSHPQHEYWEEAGAPSQTGLLRHPSHIGHRQVTDVYLLSLAADRSQCVATLDRGLVSFATAAELADAVELVSATPSIQEPRPRYRRTG